MSQTTKTLTKNEKMIALGLNPVKDAINDNTLNKLYEHYINNDFYSDETKNGKMFVLRLDPEIDEIDDDVLNKLYNFVNKKNTNRNNVNDNDNIKTNTHVRVKTPKTIKLNHDHPKYILLLEFLNDILRKLNKNQINSVTDFTTRRDDLLKLDCEKIIDEYTDRISNTFGRSNIRLNMRPKISNYILTLIKYMTSFCGYKFISEAKSQFIEGKKDTFKYDNFIQYSIYA